LNYNNPKPLDKFNFNTKHASIIYYDTTFYNIQRIDKTGRKALKLAYGEIQIYQSGVIMRKLSIAIISVVLALTFGCNTNQTSFSDTIPDLYTLSTSVSPDDVGTVHPAGGEFATGEGILIEARPSDGYVFERWNEDLTGNSNPDSIFFNTNKTITAHFIARDYDLNIEINGEGFVRETVIEHSSGENENSGPLTATVRLHAEAEEGWVFDRWEGDLNSTSNPETLIVDGEKNVTVIFGQEESDEPDAAIIIEEVKSPATSF